MMVSAGDLISLYLGLELQSLALYVSPPSTATTRKSTEAGLKYFVLGALSSGLLLYGASLIYGFAGSMQLRRASPRPSTAGEHRRRDLRPGVPDLPASASRSRPRRSTCGRPTSTRARRRRSTAFFAGGAEDRGHGAVRPRHADGVLRASSTAVAADRRLRLDRLDGAAAPFAGDRPEQHQAPDGLFLDRQHRLRAGRPRRRHGEGAQGVLIYHRDLCGDDARLVRLHPRHASATASTVEHISDLAGLSRTNPLMAFIFAMLLFSLAGMPPLAGFFAKWYVFVAAIKAGLFTLAVIGVLTSVVGAYYYLRIVKIMYFDEPAGQARSRALRIAHGARGRGPLQHPVLRLSGAAGQRCDIGGEIAVLDGIHARSARNIRGLPSRCLRPDRLDQRGGVARARAGERGPTLVRRHRSRPPAAAGATAPGSRRAAISRAAFWKCSTLRLRSPRRSVLPRALRSKRRCARLSIEAAHALARLGRPEILAEMAE